MTFRYIKENIKPGDILEYQMYMMKNSNYGPVVSLDRRGIWINPNGYVAEEVRIPYNSTIRFYTREENPEMFI